MASLLYRLGLGAAKRAWVVITSWLVVLGLAAGAFFTFGGELTDEVTIPNTPTTEVTDQMSERFGGDDASGASGQLVFSTENDEAFTQEQEDAIGDLIAKVGDTEGVTETVDPFETTATIQEQRTELEDGETQIADAREQLEDGQAQLDAAREQLDEGQAQLDAARAQAEAAGQLAAVEGQLDAQQAELDAGLEQLDEEQQTLDEGREELNTQEETLTDGAALLGLTEGYKQVSDSNSAALATVQFEDNPISESLIDTITEKIDAEPIDGVQVERGGALAGALMPQVFGPGEAVGLAIAAITLFIMLGTLIGAGLPLINALIGVGVGVLSSLALSSAFEMNSITPILGIMLGLAVGIDYSLFILNRHRRQLRDGVALRESIGLANGTSGNAVVFAGLTVVIALLALNITGIPFLGLMGTVGAICVAVAILVAVTLTPALLGLVGNRIMSKKERKPATQPSKPLPMQPMSTKRAVLTLTTGIIGLLIVAIPALDMRLGLPDNGSAPLDSAEYKSYTLIEEEFGPGHNGPLLAVAELPEPVAEEDVVGEQARIGEAIDQLDHVESIVPAGVSNDSELLAFQVIPTEGPNSVATEDLVHDLRDGVPGLSDVSVGVAGNASANIDISEQLTDVLPLYLAVVVGLSLLILILVFRSILVPITATAGFILSVLAAFGAVTAIFQWGWLGGLFGVHDPGVVLSFMPILLIGILFGLAMDYQLFLVSGMREAYAHGVPARLAVRRGMHNGRTVVIAAALIMVSVFGGFVFSNSIMIQTIGFGLAFGVLIDAFVVRLLLIPAAMHLLGKSAWWLPKWLDRIVPDVDVEGSKLERAHLDSAETSESSDKELVSARS